MKASAKRANATYQSFFKQPLLDRVPTVPAPTQVIYDALVANNFSIGLSDVLINTNTVSPADAFASFKLFGGLATIEFRPDFWKGSFTGIVGPTDAEVARRCLTVVANEVQKISDRLQPAKATLQMATWFECEDGGKEFFALLTKFWPSKNQIEAGFLGSNEVEYTIGPTLKNSKEGWEASFVIQKSFIAGSHVFMSYTGTYLTGGRFGTLQAQDEHSNEMLQGMLRKLGIEVKSHA